MQGNINNSWIAGFFEGDGTAYGCYRHNNKGARYYVPVVQFFQSDVDVISSIAQFLNSSFYKDNSSTSVKDAYRVSFQSVKRTKPILELLSEEYLSERRRERLRPLLKKLGIDAHWKVEMNWDWLKGFFVAEGCIYNTGKYCRYIFTQKSNQILLKDIQLFLQNNGVHSIIDSAAVRVNIQSDIKILESMGVLK